MKTILPNRKAAGRKLSQKLTIYADRPQAIVLGLARGGIIVAHEIAKILHLPLDVCLISKLGLSNLPEMAMGAIVEAALVPDYSGKITIVDENTTQIHRVGRERLMAMAARAKAELRWRERCYRSFRPMLQVRDRTIILVDDGIATGLTMHAAVNALQRHQPQKIVIATPIASDLALKKLSNQVADIVCLIVPKYFQAEDFWYQDFSPISDRQVCDLLRQQSQKILAASY